MALIRVRTHCWEHGVTHDFSWAAQTGKNLLRTRNVSEQNQKHFFPVSDTKFVSATNVARAGKRGNICVGNNVSSFSRAFRSSYVSSILITKLTFAMFLLKLTTLSAAIFLALNTSKEVNSSFSLLYFLVFVFRR